MSFPITKTSVGSTWVLALAVALWIAIETASVAMWAVAVFIALMPAVMMMVMANTPAKSMAEVIRDVEAGRSL
jgi:multisubunit Na+/H+ antiporter MnhG subunit